MPYRFPPPHRDAVGSMGDAAVEWIEARMKSDTATRGDGLRWWQWLVLQRLLEVDAAGVWCWPIGFLSVARQLGKTWLLAEYAAWRCANPHLFGGYPQEVGHSANSVVLAKRHQAAYWQWAEAEGLTIGRMTGDTKIIWPDGSTWNTYAASNAYGRSQDGLLADEVWSWDADDFFGALWPTMAARPMGQAVLASTAHDECRSLVPSIFHDDAVCRMVWAAPPDADVTDVAVWRAASAYWDDHRRKVMALSASQPTFASQWLNQWRPEATQVSWMPEDRWSGCRDRELVMPARPAVAAVDDRPGGAGAAVAFAWRDGERVCVVAEEVESLAVAWKRASAAERVLAGATLTREPQARLLRAEGRGTRHFGPALQILRVAVLEDSVRWDGDALARQLAALEVVESREGLRVVSGANTTAVCKVVAWSHLELRAAADDPLLL